MSPAIYCSGKLSGQCKCSKICYAFEAERLNKEVLPYRMKQQQVWNALNSIEIIKYFDEYLKNKKNVKYFRYNESGDFDTTHDVTKLHILAGHLKNKHNITTYGYSSRADLFKKFNREDLNFIVRISGHKTPSYYSTTVITKNEKPPEKYITCPVAKNKAITCMENCFLCAGNNRNIAFTEH